MPAEAELVLYHMPQSRSITVLWMLEELGRPYRIEKLDVTRNEQRGAAYLKINPSGKVPAVADGDLLVTERGAIMVYLADRYAPGRLAPRPDEPDRADYLRWMFYAIGVMEPQLSLAMMKTPIAAPPGALAWGEWDTMIGVLEKAAGSGRYLLGDRFSAADIMVGSFIGWAMQMGLLPKEGAMADYAARTTDRPSWARTLAADGTR